jgi:hypothetical protein
VAAAQGVAGAAHLLELPALGEALAVYVPHHPRVERLQDYPAAGAVVLPPLHVHLQTRVRVLPGRAGPPLPRGAIGNRSPDISDRRCHADGPAVIVRWRCPSPSRCAGAEAAKEAAGAGCAT